MPGDVVGRARELDAVRQLLTRAESGVAGLVLEGVTFYELDDPCTAHVVKAGQSFVDDGHGHMVRNTTSQPAQDVSVITAPVGGVFRTNIDPPRESCSSDRDDEDDHHEHDDRDDRDEDDRDERKHHKGGRS